MAAPFACSRRGTAKLGSRCDLNLTGRKAMTRLALTLAATLCGLAAAQAASPYPVHLERQRGQTLVIEHTPVAGQVVSKAVRVKTVRKHRIRPAKTMTIRKAYRRKAVHVRYSHGSAIAGGCRGAGYVRRQLPGGVIVLLHRDVCEGIAPISSLPGRF